MIRTIYLLRSMQRVNKTPSPHCSHKSPLCQITDATARRTYYNLPFDQLHAPVLGPVDPTAKGGVAAGLRNHLGGHVEDAHLSHFHFDDQYNTFMTCAIHPSLTIAPSSVYNHSPR